MSIARLDPGTFVEMDDPIIGGRKLGLVDTTGLGYFDLVGAGELPKVLDTGLTPKALGSIQSWAKALPTLKMRRFSETWSALMKQNLDVLTVARALRWGLENDSVEVELLMSMGIEATNRIIRGREVIESAVPAPGGEA